MLQSNEKIIKHKVGLLNLAEELGNVSKACQIMGLSRDTFYRYKSAVEDGGVEALLDRTRRHPNLKNRVDLETEDAVVAFAIEYPAHGQVRVSNELRKQGVFVLGVARLEADVVLAASEDFHKAGHDEADRVGHVAGYDLALPLDFVAEFLAVEIIRRHVAEAGMFLFLIKDGIIDLVLYDAMNFGGIKFWHIFTYLWKFAFPRGMLFV